MYQRRYLIFVETAGASSTQTLRWNEHTDKNVVDADGHRYGRIAPMHVGTPREAYTFYCREHHCRVCKRTKDTPSIASILQWFADTYVHGYGAEGLGAHIAALPKP